MRSFIDDGSRSVGQWIQRGQNLRQLSRQNFQFTFTSSSPSPLARGAPMNCALPVAMQSNVRANGPFPQPAAPDEPTFQRDAKALPVQVNRASTTRLNAPLTTPWHRNLASIVCARK